MKKLAAVIFICLGLMACGQLANSTYQSRIIRNKAPNMMDNFEYRGNQLFAEDVPVSAIASEFGTPTLRLLT